MTLPAPVIVANRYELQHLVGQGGCGVVYRATDRTNGRAVAVKMLTGAARQDRTFVERLVREQQAMQALAGTHAVGAIDLCRASGGTLCLVMEWLDGIDLEQRLSDLDRQAVRMEPAELLSILRPVLETLEKAHELGIVHRDVKPANIFLLDSIEAAPDQRGVRLLDFGLSRLKSSATLTAIDTVMGSPSYIAPEAWREGSKAIARQADLYAVAVIVFRALTGRVPFEGSSLLETMRLVTQSPRPSLAALRPDLAPAIDAWVERALAVDPAQRFQHASSLLAALVAVLHGLPIPAYTLPADDLGTPSVPPPAISASERQNALSTALSRATSLLKRLAHSISRGPTPAAPSAQQAEPKPLARLPEPPRPLRTDEQSAELQKPRVVRPPPPKRAREPEPSSNERDRLISGLLDSVQPARGEIEPPVQSAAADEAASPEPAAPPREAPSAPPSTPAHDTAPAAEAAKANEVGADSSAAPPIASAPPPEQQALAVAEFAPEAPASEDAIRAPEVLPAPPPPAESPSPPAPKKAATKKHTMKKTTPKKAAPKKPAPKKVASKKTAPKKVASKRAASKKRAPEKAATKKPTPKQTAPQKSPSKPTTGTRKSKATGRKSSAAKQVGGTRQRRR